MWGRGIFSLICELFKFAIPNLSHIYFCISEIFKTGVENRVLTTKYSFEFVGKRCEFANVIKSFYQMFLDFWSKNVLHISFVTSLNNNKILKDINSPHLHTHFQTAIFCYTFNRTKSDRKIVF